MGCVVARETAARSRPGNEERYGGMDCEMRPHLQYFHVGLDL